jgi:hypothetical protein
MAIQRYFCKFYLSLMRNQMAIQRRDEREDYGFIMDSNSRILDRKPLVDMTLQQASLSGVIICPALCRTAVKGELLHRNTLYFLGRGYCACQQCIRQTAVGEPAE